MGFYQLIGEKINDTRLWWDDQEEKNIFSHSIEIIISDGTNDKVKFTSSPTSIKFTFFL